MVDLKKLSKDELLMLQSKLTAELRFREPDVRLREMAQSIRNLIKDNEYTDAMNLEWELYGEICKIISDGCDYPKTIAEIGLEIYKLNYERR